MEYRPLKITLISAEGIKDVNLISKMDVYAVVSLAGYPKSKNKTPVDKDCGTNPKWNHRMEFIVDEPYLTKPGLSLVVQLFAEKTLRTDKEIGSVTIPIHDLFQAQGNTKEERVVEYQVRMESGKTKGSVKLSYSFGDKFSHQAETKAHTATEPVTPYPNKPSDEPVTAYPAGAPGMAAYPPQQQYQQYPPQNAYGGYPPQSSGYGGGYHQAPPPAGPYGYPQPPPHGYAAYQQPQKPKKNKMGMGGLGMGLGAGLLGGLLVGDMVGDIGESAAYADGYGDAMGGDMDMGGGFDF